MSYERHSQISQLRMGYGIIASGHSEGSIDKLQLNPLHLYICVQGAREKLQNQDCTAAFLRMLHDEIPAGLMHSVMITSQQDFLVLYDSFHGNLPHLFHKYIFSPFPSKPLFSIQGSDHISTICTYLMSLLQYSSNNFPFFLLLVNDEIYSSFTAKINLKYCFYG